jgi:hypothetical protein
MNGMRHQELTPSRTTQGRIGRWIVLSWIAAVALALAIAAVAGRTNQPTTTAPRGGSLQGLSATHPLLGGQQVPVGEVSSDVGYSVPIPNAEEASQSSLTATWVRTDQGQVALVFDDGKLTIMMQPANYEDPATEFKTFIDENNGDASIGQVNGQPALVIEPRTDASKSNLAWVEFDFNGIDVNVVSATYGTDQLLAVADSMQAGVS